MKKIFFISMVSLIVFSLSSCSKNPSDIFRKVQDLYKAGNNKDVQRYYTKGSIKVMDKLEKLVPQSQSNEGRVDKKFAEGAEWEVVDEKIDGDAAEVKIKYTEHPVENMKGLEITFNMKKEDGEWKIDMEKELLMGLDMIKGMHDKMEFFKR